MRSIAYARSRCCPLLLPVVIAAVWLWGALALAGDASDWLTGPGLVKKLESSESIAWSGRPLRDALAELSSVHRIAILLDRRIDPGQPLELSRQQTPLGELLSAVAEDRELGISHFGPVVVFGPPQPTRRLRTVAELRRLELPRLAQGTKAKWVRLRAWRWDDLATPRSLLEQIAADADFAIENLDVIPHDLWAAGDLPPLSIADRLTLVLGQFDLTFELVNPQGDVRLVPIPAEVAIERSYPAGRQAAERAEQLRQRLPEARIRVEETKIVVAGLVEDHERVDDDEASKSPSGTNSTNLDRIEITLTVKQIPLEQVLDKLQQQLGLELRIDRQKLAAADRSLDERVSFELKKASLDAALRAALEPAGLTFRRAGKQVEIVPDEDR